MRGASLLALAVGAALFAINLSKRITKTLITPLQGIAEHADGSEFAVPFDELKPFVETMKQRQAAKNNMEQMRQEFTANVSHELKTPLTSISGYAEMIAHRHCKGRGCSKLCAAYSFGILPSAVVDCGHNSAQRTGLH